MILSPCIVLVTVIFNHLALMFAFIGMMVASARECMSEVCLFSTLMPEHLMFYLNDVTGEKPL